MRSLTLPVGVRVGVGAACDPGLALQTRFRLDPVPCLLPEALEHEGFQGDVHEAQHAARCPVFQATTALALIPVVLHPVAGASPSELLPGLQGLRVPLDISDDCRVLVLSGAL